LALRRTKAFLSKPVDHVGAGADGRGLEALGAHALVVGLGQDVAGEEVHPLEDRGVEGLHVGRHLVAVSAKFSSVAPDELIGLPVSGSAGAGEGPGHVLGGEGGAVVPGDAVAHDHADLGAVLFPAPFGEEARGGLEVGCCRMNWSKTDW
jgi:hypothetical protein